MRGWAPVAKRCIPVHIARGRCRFFEEPPTSRRRGRIRLSFRTLPWGASFGVMKCGVVRGLGARRRWATCSPCLGLSRCIDVASEELPIGSCGRRESPIRLRENKIHGWVVGEYHPDFSPFDHPGCVRDGWSEPRSLGCASQCIVVLGKAYNAQADQSMRTM